MQLNLKEEKIVKESIEQKVQNGLKNCSKGETIKQNGIDFKAGNNWGGRQNFRRIGGATRKTMNYKRDIVTYGSSSKKQ